jgi:hypothetical protein
LNIRRKAYPIRFQKAPKPMLSGLGVSCFSHVKKLKKAVAKNP